MSATAAPPHTVNCRARGGAQLANAYSNWAAVLDYRCSYRAWPGCSHDYPNLVADVLSRARARAAAHILTALGLLLCG